MSLDVQAGDLGRLDKVLVEDIFAVAGKISYLSAKWK